MGAPSHSGQGSPERPCFQPCLLAQLHESEDDQRQQQQRDQHVHPLLTHFRGNGKGPRTKSFRGRDSREETSGQRGPGPEPGPRAQSRLDKRDEHVVGQRQHQQFRDRDHTAEDERGDEPCARGQREAAWVPGQRGDCTTRHDRARQGEYDETHRRIREAADDTTIADFGGHPGSGVCVLAIIKAAHASVTSPAPRVPDPTIPPTLFPFPMPIGIHNPATGRHRCTSATVSQRHDSDRVRARCSSRYRSEYWENGM